MALADSRRDASVRTLTSSLVKTASPLSAQPVSQGSLRRSSPRYRSWTSFVDNFEELQRTHVTVADERRFLKGKRSDLSHLAIQIKTMASNLADATSNNEPLKLSLLDITTQLGSLECHLAEVQTLEKENNLKEEQLMTQEFNTYKIRPWQKDKEGTFSDLILEGYDFPENSGSMVSDPPSWTSERPPDPNDSSTICLSPTDILTRVDEIETELSDLRGKRSELVERILSKKSELNQEPEMEEMDKLDDREARLEIDHDHARRRLLWKREDIDHTGQSRDDRYYPNPEQGGNFLHRTTAEANEVYGAAMSLFVAQPETLPMFQDRQPHEPDTLDTLVRINAWLFHKMRCSEYELASFAATISHYQVSVFPTRLIDGVYETWYKDDIHDDANPRPIESIRKSVSVIMDVGATISKQRSNLAPSNGKSY